MSARATPLMQQHRAAKNAHPDAIVFFRLGDFYEMFEDDAVLCARLLDLTLTSRNKGKPDEVPMAGVPHHSAHGYIGRLLSLGYKVAICEQLVDPATVKGIVPREVVRVLTPGTVTSSEHLDVATNNWLAALEVGESRVGVAFLDVSTGELRAAGFGDLTGALGELSRSLPREVVAGGAVAGEGGASLAASIRAVLGDTPVRDDPAIDAAAVEAALGPLAREASRLPVEVRAAVARALRYARACSPGVELPVRGVADYDPAEHLVLDPVAQRHLELVESPAGRKATLLGTIDVTRTPPGARLLRRRLLSPLANVARIRRRLDQVELFVDEPRLRGELRQALGAVGDLERLAVRVELGEATPKDLGALRDGLAAARAAVAVATRFDAPTAQEVLRLGESIDTIDDIASALSDALAERPPASEKEGAIFRAGFDAELDEAERLRRHGTELMIALETKLREETSIATLKVRFTRVFGWYVEVTRSQAARAPSAWRRKQTVAGGERFTLPELDELADRIAHAEERHRERELALLGELFARVKAASERITALSERLARWDVASALAEMAHRFDYRRPDVDASDVLTLEDGRHPVVEQLAAAGRFVPNDVSLEASADRLWIVTGPNMAGKSTLLRQVALSVVLAQLGSFVPARSARIGVVDRVLSRVGASDNLSRGESTFMVEMRETAEILRKATPRSLVILDEIGRGTSTFDGLAIAWAVAEYLDQAARCRTLFATHYHELTALAATSDHVRNVSVSAEESGGDVVFLHRLVKGPASRSYGVAVAKLAGLPESVLARSRALLEMLESGGSASGAAPSPAKRTQKTPQLDLFGASGALAGNEREVLDTLRGVDVDRLTPLDALSLVARLKTRLGKNTSDPTK
ncbi:MAG TPA: DNA mismatch repair protein MutS [Polyangiaceae bacterium]|nr:DNA mismatch repair protein MutS [Polyangiaceae bacterium]